MTYITKNTEETEALGARLAAALDATDTARAFIAMQGEMGVGKTAFTRGFASALGIPSVKSPTYTIVNEHRGKRNLFHFDMYRIDGEDDLLSIAFDEYLERDGYSVAEWSENITEFLPEDSIFVTIRRTEHDESTREIEISLGEKYENIGI